MRIDEILMGAIELNSPAEQQAYLDDQCGSDADLRSQVQSLLESHQQAGSFLKGPGKSQGPTTMRSPVSETAGCMIGRYKLLQKIGEGGFGIVFMAEQQQPIRRKVALKIIKPGMDSKDVVARFEAERQALALMDHPNIARVLDGGTTESGRPYFVMELVKGKSITEYCDANKLGVRQRLELHTSVCQAVQHAHSKGIIHRDLKPSNIMITLHDGKPVVKVIDFGVSKALNQRLTERTLFTAYGQMVGTPQYMSPEQAEMSGLDVDTRSDIYSLGVLMYELLTGGTPLTDAQLKSAAYAEIQQLIRDQEPPRPSTRISTAGEELTILADHRSETPQRLHQLVRGDLDLIVMKALEKDRTRRYETAAGFANDIERYLHDEPVKACPPSATYRMWKFYRRNRGWVTAASLLAIMLVVGVIGTTTGWVHAALIGDQLQEKNQELAKQGKQLTDRTNEAVAGQKREMTARQQAERDRELAEKERNKANRSLYMAQIQLAHHALDRPHAGTVEETLERWMPEPGQPDYRGWEWYYLLSQSRKDLVWTLHDHIQPVQNVAWANDNRRFASVGDDGVARVWDVTTGKQIAQLAKTKSTPRRLRWSPDGTTIATGHHDGTIHLWDGTSYAEKGVLEGHEKSPTWVPSISSIDFSKDGKRLASCGWDQTVNVWNVVATKHIRSFAFGESIEKGANQDLGSALKQVAMSPDGTRVAAISGHQCKAWSTASGDELFDLSDRVTLGRCIAWSPDGTKIAMGIGYASFPNYVVIVRDVETGNQLCKLRGHKGGTWAIAWNASGNRIVTGSQDRTIRVWSAEDGVTLNTLQGHKAKIMDVRFSPDDRYIVSGADDGTVRVWNADRSATEQQQMTAHEAVVTCTAWSPDGTRVASGSWDTTIRIWDVATRKCIRTLYGHTGGVNSIAWAPDGKRLASASSDKSARVWDAATGESSFAMNGHSELVQSITWSPDGRTIATAGYDKLLKTWDAATGEHLGDFQGQGDFRIHAVTWSPNGKYLACISPTNIRVWEYATDRNVAAISYRYTGAKMIAFSPNGRELACVKGHDVVLYNIEEDKIRSRLSGHTGEVQNITWNQDGSRLATSSFDGTIRIWDSKFGRELLTFAEHVGTARTVSWSPDGQAIASGSEDGGIRIWDASKGYELMEDPTFIAGQTIRQYHKAKELEQQGKHERALELLTDVLKWKPEDTSILRERANVYARIGQWKRAADDFTRICELEPNNVWAHWGSALTRLQIQDTERFKHHCNRLLELTKSPDMGKGLAAWTCLLAPKLTQDLPGSKEAIEQSCQAAKKTPDRRLLVRIADIRRGKPTAEPKPPKRDLTLQQQATGALWESIRLIQLDRQPAAREQYQRAQQLIKQARGKPRGSDWWINATCGILSREVEQRLSEAAK